MTDQGKKYLSDIIFAIELIEKFLIPIHHYNDYLADLKTQSAIERQLGIIGEAVIRFNMLLPEQNLQHGEKIRGFRNRLIHAYDNIDPAIIWAIVNNHLGPLKLEVLDKLNT